ncbi:MAG: DNA recombination protein RmuC [Candidatus Nitrospinota bacterium M3_3B_026]
MSEIILYAAAFVIAAGVLLCLYGLLLLKGAGDKIGRIEDSLESFDRGQERVEKAFREEIFRFREEFNNAARNAREEQRDTFMKQLNSLTESNERMLGKMRETMEARLRDIQEDNNAKLERMRATVDEKLHDTLEKRLGSSFRMVSDQLEKVHKDVGEMRSLASGVGDLKKALTGIRSRGVWGEVQLGALLEQILSPEQYAANVATKNGSERVEFAVKFPGGERTGGGPVWMPLDAKFPLEDYQRLVDAQEAADQGALEKAGKALETRIRDEAKKIRDKYLDPPNTTDFGVMFLPTEGLYAEVIRRPGLWDYLIHEARVAVTGPTTLAALLNSLQVGFRTLAIEKRAGEVWRLLSEVKTEFGKFGSAIESTKKKLEQARSSIDTVDVRTRAITKKLTDVQELPEHGDGGAENSPGGGEG